MNLNKAIKLYAITHREYMKQGFVEAVRESIEGGVTMIQVREKDLDEEAFCEQVRSIKELCCEKKIPLIVNDNPEVLARTDVDGLHIGQRDEALKVVRERFKDKIIGVSVSCVEEALEAERNGADYLGVGAIFSTDTKGDAQNIGFEMLKAITMAVKIPVCAIGGITSKNIDQLQHSGIEGVAVISDIYNKEDVRKAAAELKRKISNITIKKVLTIAGSDSSGGAGIQADLKTFAAHKKYGMSVITAITAQNTMSVDYVEEISKFGVMSQIKAVFDDIVPDAIKIGMVSNIEIIKQIAESLREQKAKNIVLDPVMVSTSGFKLLNDDAIQALKEELFPLAKLITPNIPEAELLAGMEIKTEEDMIVAAEKIGKENKISVLVKGGHLVNDAIDILYEDGRVTKIVEERVDTKNTHGTGCTLSSAICCNIADGFNLKESIALAKRYLVNAMKNDLDLGKASGPLNHIYALRETGLCLEKI